jgi:hypothetical protein
MPLLSPVGAHAPASPLSPDHGLSVLVGAGTRTSRRDTALRRRRAPDDLGVRPGGPPTPGIPMPGGGPLSGHPQGRRGRADGPPQRREAPPLGQDSGEAPQAHAGPSPVLPAPRPTTVLPPALGPSPQRGAQGFAGAGECELQVGKDGQMPPGTGFGPAARPARRSRGPGRSYR